MMRWAHLGSKPDSTRAVSPANSHSYWICGLLVPARGPADLGQNRGDSVEFGHQERVCAQTRGRVGFDGPGANGDDGGRPW